MYHTLYITIKTSILTNCNTACMQVHVHVTNSNYYLCNCNTIPVWACDFTTSGRNGALLSRLLVGGAMPTRLSCDREREGSLTLCCRISLDGRDLPLPEAAVGGWLSKSLFRFPL